nr:substrate-binding domain-containing protein [Helicobacter cholecystus]
MIYRTFNVVAMKNASKEAVDFVAFLSSKDAEKIFKKFGWSK